MTITAEYLQSTDFKELKRIDSQTAADIASALRYDQAPIKELNLSKKEIRFEDLCQIFDALKTNTTVSKLDLSSMELNDQELEKLAELLSSNQTLTNIDLSDNGFKTIAPLAEALTNHDSLAELDLSENDIFRDSDIKYLAMSLITNKTLKILNLRSQYIDTQQIDLFNQVLEENKTLLNLLYTLENLRKKKVPLKSINQLNLALYRNQQLAEDLPDPNIKPLSIDDGFSDMQLNVFLSRLEEYEELYQLIRSRLINTHLSHKDKNEHLALLTHKIDSFLRIHKKAIEKAGGIALFLNRHNIFSGKISVCSLPRQHTIIREQVDAFYDFVIKRAEQIYQSKTSTAEQAPRASTTTQVNMENEIQTIFSFFKTTPKPIETFIEKMSELGIFYHDIDTLQKKAQSHLQNSYLILKTADKNIFALYQVKTIEEKIGSGAEARSHYSKIAIEKSHTIKIEKNGEIAIYHNGKKSDKSSFKDFITDGDISTLAAMSTNKPLR